MNIPSVSIFSMLVASVAAAALGFPAAQMVQTRGRTQSSATTRCLVTAMNGTDVGARINACDAQLGSNRGEIVLNGGGTITTPVIISSNHTLRVSGGIYKATAGGPVIRLKDNSALVCDSLDAVLEESTGKNGDAGVKPFTIVAAYSGSSRDALNGTLAQGVSIKGCHFRGARSDFDSASQTIALLNCHDCSVTNNWLESTRTIGIQTGGGSRLGNYADNVIIAKNLLTNVASQNIAVVNSSNVQVTDNTMRAPGMANGPGVVPIDIEPNVGDRIVNVKIVNNLVDMTNTAIDARGAKGLHGIAINNLNRANPFTGVEVSNNTIYGADLKDPHNHVSGGLILVRGAANTLIANNTLRRGTYCILIDSGSSGVTVRGNQLSSCGSGSTQSVRIVDSSNNLFLDNKLWGDPANLFDLSQIGKLMVEMGASDNNTFRGNDAIVGLSGRGSRKQ